LPPDDEQRGVGGDRCVGSCDGGIDQEVSESGCAVVDGGDAERGGRRVGHPDGDAVADAEIAGVREDAAYGDGVVVDVTQRAVDHDRVERAHRQRAA
jgi:hypothetical protein